MTPKAIWVLSRRGYGIRVMNDASQAHSLLDSLQRIWPEEQWRLAAPNHIRNREQISRKGNA